MRVYLPGSKGRKAHLVTPGNQFESSEFMDEDGKPRTFAVEFINGEADVPDNLARYLIDHGIAKRSPLILPPGV